MQEYRRSLTADPVEDLAKRAEAEPTPAAAHRPIYRTGVFWTIVCAVLVLAVALPLAFTLGRQQTSAIQKEPDSFFGMDDEYCTMFYSLEQYQERYSDALVPLLRIGERFVGVAEHECVFVETRVRPTDEVLCVFTEIPIEDGVYSYVRYWAYRGDDNRLVKGHRLKSAVAEVQTIDSATLRYRTEPVADETQYTVYFDYNGVYYRVQAGAYTQTTPAQIIYDLFGLQ